MSEVYVVRAPWFGWRVRARANITTLPQKCRDIESKRFLRRKTAERWALNWKAFAYFQGEME